MRGDAIPEDAPLHAPAPPVLVPLFPLLVTSHLPGKGKYLINVIKLTSFCSCQPHHAPRDPQPPSLGRVAAGHVPSLPMPR